MGTKWSSKETRERATAMYWEGHTLEEIAVDFGKSRQTIKNWLDAAGGTRGYSAASHLALRRGHKENFLGYDVRDRLKEKYLEGYSGEEAALIVGVNAGTARNRLRLMGVARTHEETHALTYKRMKRRGSSSRIKALHCYPVVARMLAEGQKYRKIALVIQREHGELPDVQVASIIRYLQRHEEENADTARLRWTTKGKQHECTGRSVWERISTARGR